jgi:hypothetical protein
VLSLALASASTTGALSSTDWVKFNTAYNDSIVSANVSGTTTKTLTLTQQDAGTITASWTDLAASGTVTSVAATVPAGLTISGSPIVSAGTLAFGLDTGYTIPLSTQLMPTGGSTGQILTKNSATNYDTIWSDNYADWTEQIRDTVKAEVAINKGQAVYISGANGTNQLVSLASNTTEPLSSKTLGLAMQNLAINGIGAIITEGLLGGLNTSTATAGDPVWLGVSGNLIYGLANKPVAPAHLVYIGVVTRVQSNNGEIYVKIQNGFELQELHNVLISSVANNEGLFYESATTLWKNKSIATVLGYTPISLTSLSGVSPLSYNNTTGAFSIAQATTSANGYLSSTDWNTFNGKQSALSGTGFVKISGTTISYDNSTYYLASNPSAYIALTGLSATAPLSYNNTTGGFTISQAGVSGDGYLSSTDWNTFNNKQASGNYITALSGEATASGPGSAAVTLSTSAVTGKILTGVNITGGSITATDSILVAFGKVQNQINGVLGGAIYQSVWNASTNSPTLTSGTGTKGYYYIVSVAGSTNLDGITDWKVGDWAIFNGTTWNKVDNTDAVSSVNGYTGAVSLTTSDITEGSRLYYTEGRVSANTDVAANTAARHAAVTLGTANGLSLSTQALSLALASTSATGALSSTDWNTFNLKQAALSGTGFVKISGSTISYDNSTYYLASNPTAYISLLALSSSATGLTYTNTTGVFSFTAGYSIPTNASQTQWDTAYSNRISTLNGLTAATQNFSTGMSGTDFNISSTTATHTFNIPDASATARGFVNTGTQTFAGAKTFSAALNGTSAIFTSTISAGDTITITAPASSTALALLGRSTDNFSALRFKSNNGVTTYATIYSNASDLVFENNGTPRLTITSTGEGTFSIPSLSANTYISNINFTDNTNNTGHFGIIRNSTSGNGAFYGADGIVELYTNMSVTNVKALSLSTTGAATFSNSITMDYNFNGSSWFTAKNTNAGSGAAAGLLMTNNGGDLAAISLLSSTNSPANALYIRTLSTNSLVLGTNSGTNLTIVNGGAASFSSNVTIGGSGTTTSKLTILATTGVAAPGSPSLGIYDVSNPSYGFDFDLEGIATGDLYLSRLVAGTRTPVLQLSRATGAAIFTSSVTASALFSSSLTATSAIFNNATNSTDGIKIIASLTSSAFTSGIELYRTGVSGGTKIEPIRDISIGGVGLKFLVTANNTAEINATYTTALQILNTLAATFYGSVTATGFFESSDSRLKTLIQDNYQTKGIASITPKLYTKNGKVELGYYAQDFVGILDSAVSKGSDDMLSLSYREVLVAKVYALEQEIKELKAKMN